MVAILTYLPAGSARWMDVRAKSPSIDCPVDDPTLALKASSGSDLMQFSFMAADELAYGLQIVFVISKSKEDWKAVVSGLVRGKAPPLWRMAPRKSPSSRPPYAIIWEYIDTAPALQIVRYDIRRREDRLTIVRLTLSSQDPLQMLQCCLEASEVPIFGRASQY
jgi:hypothetical protein